MNKTNRISMGDDEKLPLPVPGAPGQGDARAEILRMAMEEAKKQVQGQEVRKTSQDKLAEMRNKLREKKTELFAEIAKKAFANVPPITLPNEKPDAAVYQSLISQAVPVVVATEFAKTKEYETIRTGMLALEGSVKIADEVAKMFADEAIVKLRKLYQVSSFDSMAKGAKIAFKIDYDKDKGEFSVQKLDPEKAAAVDLKKQEVDRLAQELKDNGLLGFVFQFLGVIDPDSKVSEDQQYRDIVSGKNYFGKLVCGFFGFSFAKGDMDKVRGMIPSKEGQKVFDNFRKKLTGFTEGLVPQIGEADQVKNFVRQLAPSATAEPQDKAVALEVDEGVPPQSDIEVTIPKDGSVKLVGRDGGGSVVVVEGGVSQAYASGTEIVAGTGTRVVRIKAGQILGKGTMFGAGVTVAKAEIQQGGGEGEAVVEADDPYTGRVYNIGYNSGKAEKRREEYLHLEEKASDEGIAGTA